MTYVHPVFMIVLLCVIWFQVRLGKRILATHERSPEFALRGARLQQHRQLAFGLLVLVIAGALGGLGATLKFLPPPAPGESGEIFNRTYGHGYFGLLILGILVTTTAVGLNIKSILKDKIRKRFMLFHENMVWILLAFVVCSILTGVAVIWKGPA
jgi:hypothetical protein